MNDFESEADIQADVAAALKELEGAPDNAPAPQPEAPQTEIEAPAAAEDDAAKAKARDEQGRFAKAEEKVQNPEATPDADATPQPETSRPPHTLKATLKAKWAVLDPEVRQEFERVEAEAQKARTEWNSKAERHNKFDALVAPHRDRLTLNGLDEFRYLESLIKADEMLRTQPQQALSQIASLYGVSLPGFQQQPGQQIPQAQEDPRFSELQRQVASLNEVLTTRQEAEERAQTDQARTAWMTFREDASNPYAENVKEDMALLLREGRAQDLKSAYEMAVWANPETRKLMMAAGSTTQTQKDTRPAGLGITGAPGLGRQPAAQADPRASIEDDVRNAIQQLSGRI